LYAETAFKEYKGLDVAIGGEWEGVFTELVNDTPVSEIRGITYRCDGKTVINPEGPLIEDLDIVPFPDRSQFDHTLSFRPDTHEAEATIRVSRGCPFDCIYCLAPVVCGKKMRMRSPHHLVDEIVTCREKYDICNFLFRSDLFTIDGKWLFQVCDEIDARNLKINWACNTRVDTIDEEKVRRMKKAGCWAVAMGIESGNAESLSRMNKKITLEQSESAVKICKEEGLQVFTYFLIGFPWETKQHIEDTINFAIKLDADLAQFSPLYPYPGTKLYNDAKSLGLVKDEDLHPYALVKPVMGTQFLSKEEIEDYLLIAWRRFHLRPRFILRTLWKARSPKKIFNYIRFGLQALMKLSRNRRKRIRESCQKSL